MWCGIITLFPDMFAALGYGITGRAIDKGLLKLNCWNPRDFTDDPYSSVDDRPYGGGPGMVMKAGPMILAINAARCVQCEAKVIYLSPQGKRVTQKDIGLLAKEKAAIFVAGRYEGIDERVCDLIVDEEWSIGDYVLSGGELAAMVLIDALTRLLPGALGDEESAAQDSFADGLLDYPHYTRPEEFLGLKVPEVLLTGNHAAIVAWRKQQQLKRTRLRRPDLLCEQKEGIINE